MGTRKVTDKVIIERCRQIKLASTTAGLHGGVVVAKPRLLRVEFACPARVIVGFLRFEWWSVSLRQPCDSLATRPLCTHRSPDVCTWPDTGWAVTDNGWEWINTGWEEKQRYVMSSSPHVLNMWRDFKECSQRFNITESSLVKILSFVSFDFHVKMLRNITRPFQKANLFWWSSDT